MIFWSNIKTFLFAQSLASVVALFAFIFVTNGSLKNINTNNNYSIFKTFFNSII